MKTDAAQLRRGIGYVIQQAGLFPHRTIVDNVATVPLLLGWSKTKARDRAMELMETVGLTPRWRARYPAQLSGGQQQRVGVARALAADPPVLLMDEPFSAVDPVVRESLQDELLRLQAELGKTIVFVTHDIDEAVKLGDRVAVFRVGGKLAQYDEPGVLLARPADDFVDSFVGRDRGYRGLSFRSSEQLPLHELRTVALRRTHRARLEPVPRRRRSPPGLAPRPRRRRHRGRRRPGPRRVALRRGHRLAAQCARRGAVVTVRAGGRGRRRRAGGRRRHRGRRAGGAGRPPGAPRRPERVLRNRQARRGAGPGF